jgi:hypothetical protein
MDAAESLIAMGKVVRCPECRKVFDDIEELEDLRSNDSICLVCNAPIEVADWDRVLASYEEDEDLDDLDDDDIEDSLDDDFGGWDDDDLDDDDIRVEDDVDDLEEDDEDL